MVSPEEKARRKALKQFTRQAERDRIRAGLLMSPEQMRGLFDFVDQQISVCECNGSLKCTRLFLGQQGLPADPVIQWLEAAGAYCDCEILANAEETFLFALDED